MGPCWFTVRDLPCARLRRLTARGVWAGRLKLRRGSNVAWPWRIRMRECCGRYSPKVRVIDQRRFPPASPKLVEGTAGGKRLLPTRDCAGGFNNDGEPVRPALSKPELRRGPRGHTSDEVESARIPSGPGVSKSHPSKRPDICEQPILSIKRQPCAEAGSIYVSTT